MHLTADFGQALLPCQVEIAERILVESQLIQNGRVEITEMIWLLDDFEPEFVGRTDHLATLDARASHLHRFFDSQPRRRRGAQYRSGQHAFQSPD